MEIAISKLVKSYEDGKLSRRDLVRGLALLAAGSGAAQTAGFQSSTIDHVSVYVSDLRRSTEFYQRVFGGAVQIREGNNVVTAGKSRIVLRPGKPPGRVDHFALGVENFNQGSVTADLKARGAVPLQETDIGFHVRDPDGFPVQLIAQA
jgi:catechol 2,3-dioxygenase-like lactoylglutathione lyase family enzyme